MAMLHRNESLREFFQVEHAKQKTQENSSQQDKEFNKKHDSTHRLGGVLHLRPRTQSHSVHDQWELARQQNTLMLTFYLLIHVFYSDDHELDDHEQKVIRKMFRKSRGVLYPEHFDQILVFADKEITLSDVRQYVTEHKLPPQMIQASLDDLKRLLRRKPAYATIMDHLARALK